MSTATIQTAITTTERCDRCGATAKVLARNLTTKNELYLCGHHGREHGTSLTYQGFVLLAVTHVSEV